MALEQYRDHEFVGKLITTYQSTESPVLELTDAEVAAMLIHCNTVGLAIIPEADIAEMHLAWSQMQNPQIKKILEDGLKEQSGVVTKR